MPILTRSQSVVTVCSAISIAALLSACSGGSSSSSEPEPPPPPVPVTVSIDLSRSETVEFHHEPVALTLQLNQNTNRSLTFQLELAGSARRGWDYEIDSTTLTIPQGFTSTTTNISPLNDWDAEQDETLTIDVQTTAASVTLPTEATELIIEDSGERHINKDDPNGFAFVFGDLWFDDQIYVQATMYNVGLDELDTSQLLMYLTTEPYFGSSRNTAYAVDVAVTPSFSSFQHVWTIDPQQLQANETYYILITAVDQISGIRLPGYGYDFLGFSLEDDRQVLRSCTNTDTGDETGADPLFPEQWPLSNTGQVAYAEDGGFPDADLNMTQTLAANAPTGEGVEVAVVDTGLEICHPDLASNVSAGRSFNFKALAVSEPWQHVTIEDPFQISSYGDHGTSVAGVIGASAKNGIGGRGVAPDVSLRGYNFLAEQCCFEAALGASDEFVGAHDVDIFNMSFGSAFGLSSSPHPTRLNTFQTGTNTLRDGKGAIYVKAAGNGFNACKSYEHSLNNFVGCQGSGTSTTNFVPYTIVIGALDASDQRASYSSAGSNLWVSAPAGLYGRLAPATITTDQMGHDRGYDRLARRGYAVHTDNEDGDYISTFNGTSSAAPHASGVVALTLEEEPDLTWRDVKHILASSARVLLFTLGDYHAVINGNKVTIHHGWLTNGAGYSFYNQIGFGAIDVDATLEMVRGYEPDSLGTFAESEWLTAELPQTRDIPDLDGEGLVATIDVDSAENPNIEAVWVEVTGPHEFPADLLVELTSPAGMRSILNYPMNDALMARDQLDMTLLSNAFYGESPIGTWTLRLFDLAEGDVGELDSWRLKFFTGDHP